MAADTLAAISRVRSNSGSTLKAQAQSEEASSSSAQLIAEEICSFQASLSTHVDNFSKELVLFAESCLSGTGLCDGNLVELRQPSEATVVRDFEREASSGATTARNRTKVVDTQSKPGPKYLCIIQIMSPDQAQKHHNLEISMHKQIIAAFGFTTPSRVTVTKAREDQHTSSHAEICFRDAYLSRGDMWRFAAQELIGRTFYVGQKISFLNTLKATVRSIHVNGRHAQVAYFGRQTVPVFRSEAARYLIFIQMSREMWDFDSEGDGEILFNKVVNGFLPELFKRWSSMEVRHLVSIVMFGRLEYRPYDMDYNLSAGLASRIVDEKPLDHQDFYRVVVTDMASAQWATILHELKRDFRVFLRDVSLFETPNSAAQPSMAEESSSQQPQITGRLSGALKGNVLEAINLAASQFSSDYIDRDLIRTGISTVVITAGSGVFDVDRELLKLTSETLTNNGIGIDIVCLSKMPLHSVPLFRYRLTDGREPSSGDDLARSPGSSSLAASLPHPSLPDLSASPAFLSDNASLKYFSRFPSAYPSRLPQIYGYGIPHWVDLSYWSSDMEYERSRHRYSRSLASSGIPFKPRVRMYELQMMGLMELGMADMAVPYLSERTLESDITFRNWPTRTMEPQYSRSFSHSPESRRKSPVATMWLQNSLRQAPDRLTSKGRTLAAMDDYDAACFVASPAYHDRRRYRNPKSVHKEDSHQSRDKKTTTVISAFRPVFAAATPRRVENDVQSETESIVSAVSRMARPARASRILSYGARGLMPFATKASAVTAEVQNENINAQRLNTTSTDDASENSRMSMLPKTRTTTRVSKFDVNPHEPNSLTLQPSTATNSDKASKPIKIAKSSAVIGSNLSSFTKQMRHQKYGKSDDSESDDSRTRASDITPSIPSSVPTSKIPFIRNVNASNPLKRRSEIGIFGRWQHLYPRKPRSATVKWRSLCTPASVPLTTEDFPSRDELENQYDALCHVIHARSPSGELERSQGDMHNLFLEMLSLRIAHGYQFVVGPAVSEAVEEDLADCYSICRSEAPAAARLVVMLAMGNTVQKIELHRSVSLRVTKYVQRPSIGVMSPRLPISYCPYIRTILSNGYFPRQLTIRGFAEEYRWDVADRHLADGDDVGGAVIEQLRYWRARYVLLPVEPPANALPKHQTNNENEEEIHLLGIRALTQLWQKNRYQTPDEQKLLQSRTGSSTYRDENPLEVKLETLNPSELVALELDRLTQIEPSHEMQSTQLLPEIQRLDRESSMTKIAQAIQSENGVEIKNRRWHLRLHYSCFRGEEFTNWLLQNVRDISTRKDAIEFGNHLMKEGLFEHVNDRHDFKDGHYFYSIKQPYRPIRPDMQKSWLLPSRQSDRSVPATPVNEQPSKELSPIPPRTRSGSNIAQQLQGTPLSDSNRLNEEKRKAVSLSRMICVNVDIRNKSFLGRREVVNVHYDRFHNPENCYHLELNWLSTTCKLVDDAITSWTNTADKYGLKLVEVPIAEAQDVPIAEPFRNPYRIQLALEPPKQKVPNALFNPSYFSATSFGAYQAPNTNNTARHIYQKAILKRSNFVLDLEASSEFPDGVDIEYSWGRLDYKHTQYVHRSGVVLAQIMEDGDIILLANRLYNSRLASTKDISNRGIDHRKDAGPQSHRPAIPPTATSSMQASGIVGINLASPSAANTSSPGLNPIPNLAAADSPTVGSSSNTSATKSRAKNSKSAIADSVVPKSAFAATGLWNTLITPEQIKDDLESFCLDKGRLEAFYKEVANAPTPALFSAPGSGSRKTTGSSSSSLLMPVKEVTGTTVGDLANIPAIELGEAWSAARYLRRATVAYDHSNEMFERSRIGSRNGSIASGSGSGNDREREGNIKTAGSGMQASPLRKAAK